MYFIPQTDKLNAGPYVNVFGGPEMSKYILPV
jgi:hypothetical protein